ncbi:MAG: tetratricopeptide repeat protein [Planctomycetes bacterium]|nr:tetratricopeptide repeat protein [Planctomycetota bacterium]
MCRNLRKKSIFAWPLLLVLTSALSAGPAEDQYAIAAKHYGSARWTLAAEEFASFLQQYPDHELADSAVFFHGESLVQLGRFDKSEALFAEYLRRAPDGKYACQATFRTGESVYLSGRHEAARTDLERFRQEFPDAELNAFVYCYLGEIALARDDAAAARTEFSEGLRRFPESPMTSEYRYGLGRALAALGDIDGAVRFYQFLGQNKSPQSDDALLQLAIVGYQRRTFDDAIEAADRLLTDFPGSDLTAHASYWLGMSAMASRQYPRAAETLANAAARHEQHVLAPAMSFSAAEAYRHADDREKARIHYRRVGDRWPDSSWADDSLQSLVQLAWEDDDYDRVRELAAQFVSRYPHSPLQAIVRQMEARAWIKQGDYAKAIGLLEPLVHDTHSAVSSRKENDHSERPERDDEEDLARERGSTASEHEPAAASGAAIAYYLAVAYVGAARHEDALAVLESLTGVDEPRELAEGAQLLRGTALLSLERFAEAVEPLQAYVNAHPDGADAAKCRARLAIALARLQRWPDVRQVFEQLRSGEIDGELYYSTVDFLAEAAYAQRQLELAETLYGELAKEGSPPDCAARGLSGQAWIAWSRVDGAAQSAATFEQLLARFPDSPLAAEAAMMRGQALEKSGNPEGALAMYRLVTDRYGDSPHVARAMLSAARIHDDLERDRDAEPLLRALLQHHPEFEQQDAALYMLAWVLVDLQRDDEADDVFARIHAEFRDSQYWADATYRLAERAARRDDRERADGLAAEIVEAGVEPRMVTYACYLRGQLAASAERWDDVITWMSRVARGDSSSSLATSAQYWLAEAHFRQRNFRRAGELFTELEQQTGGRTEAWWAMIPLRRAQMLAHAGQWHDAHEIASRIQRRFPEFSRQYEADYLVGRYHATLAEFDEAREAFDKVIRSEHGRHAETAAMAQWMIGETYFLQQKYPLAIKAYHRAEGLYDYPRWQAAALLQAGKCHEMLGQWDEAVTVYSQILSEHRQSPFAEKADNRMRVARQRADIYRSR